MTKRIAKQRARDEGLIVRLPRGTLVPARVYLTSRYFKGATLTNIGAIAANQVLEPTFAYDVDPTLGSTAMPGFAEWGALFRLYRVQGARLTVVFANAEAFCSEVYICPVNTNPGANYSAATAITYNSQPQSRKTVVGPLTGNNVKTLTCVATTEQFAGVWDSYDIDTYCGSTNGGTTPTNNWYFTYGAAMYGTGTAAGCNLSVTLDVDLCFFEKLSPAS